MQSIRNVLSNIHLMYISWIISILGLLGSLIYSDILLVPICPLCWYQRIAMYPLVLIFAIGIMTKDKNAFKYALPLITIGLLISIYQVLLQAGVVPNILIGCKTGDTISCATITFRLFGFLTIPQQAMLGFGGLFAASLLGVTGRE